MEIRNMRDGWLGAGLAEFAATLDGIGVMVEIGSWAGESASMFAPRVGKLICVDPWFGGARSDAAYRKWTERTMGLPNVYHHRMTSAEAATLYGPDSIDAVYIDGMHDYEHVHADILAWGPKVRAGGLLAGHDYGNKFPGVAQAVGELLGKPDRVFPDCSWSVVKRA
jgi:predicted O-methyltransferase YrrM